MFYIIILIVQQNYFSDSAEILDLLAKLFFPCKYQVIPFLYVFFCYILMLYLGS